MEYVKIENFTKTINKKVVLDNVSCAFEKGKIYGIAGKNGSGKTMLLRAVAGLITPNSGSVIVDDEKVGNGKYPKNLGIVIENVQLMENLSGLDNLLLLNSISKNKVTEDAIKNWLFKFNLDPRDKRSIKKYSLGMERKVSLIQAFMNEPELVLLDEPTNALDEGSVEILLDVIKELNEKRGVTFIIASHDKISLEEICSEIVEMKDGKIV